MTRLSARHWLIALGIAGAIHAAIALAWLGAHDRAAPAEQGEEGIAIDLTRVVDPLPAPQPEPEPEPEPEPDPEPQPEPEPQAQPVQPPEPRPSPPRAEAIAAPEPAPAPRPAQRKPAPQAAGIPQAAPPPDYQRRLHAWLAQHQVYPRASRRRGEEGTAYLSLEIARDGRILSGTISRSSGIERLDEAAREIITRASPVPPLPDSYPGETMRVVVPLQYRLR